MRATKRRSVCPVSCSLDLIGDKWNLLPIRDLFTGERHYHEFAKWACTIPAVGTRTNPLARDAASDQINWPARYAPAKATFFVTNQTEINAPPERVWEHLIAAESWPDWYAGASRVIVRGDSAGKLASGVSFTWRTMDMDFESHIHEFTPPYRLSWESRKWAIQGYHAWLLIRTPTGTKVITEESQKGFLASAEGLFIPKKLGRLHDQWLAGLKARSEAPPPLVP